MNIRAGFQEFHARVHVIVCDSAMQCSAPLFVQVVYLGTALQQDSAEGLMAALRRMVQG